jgi:molybdopterin synthase catalytic subunit
VSILVQEADFDVGAEIAALTAGQGDAGAVASFVGLVRGSDGNAADGGILAMTLEHYPGMTEQALESIVAEARRRWRLLAVTVIHRVGRLLPGERIVLVAVSSSHRGEAFSACAFIIDYLKTRAPFWKREESRAGARWVEARETDELSASRWSASE